MVVAEVPITTHAVLGLRCRICETRYPIELAHVCEECFGPLEVEYDYEALRRVVTHESIAAGPRTIWRYRPLLPVTGAALVDLGAGYTPLLRADNLARAVGLDDLYIKNDCVNPTYSFKDRVVAVAASQALALGIETLACASTGNLAAATAAAAAKAGLPCYVLVPSNLERSKIINMGVYGANVVLVDGNYDDVNRLCSEVADAYGWGFVNVNLRPFYAEGSKTLAYEVAEALDWRAPDHVVVPIASGAQLVKINKGFGELIHLGLISGPTPRVSGAQAAGCAPVATAYREGRDEITPVKPFTIAKSLAIGNPADGEFALSVVRSTGGAIDAASDPEIIEGIRLLAQTEGIFAETAGGVTVAVLKKLVASGAIKRGERTVVYVTGNGLKTPDAVADSLAEPLRVPASLDRFQEALAARSQATA